LATCHWQILCSYMCIYWRINWWIDRECIKKIPAYSEVLQLVWSACQRSKENSCGLSTERKHRCETNRRTKYNTVQMNAFLFCMLFSYIILLFNFFYHWILLFTYTIHAHRMPMMSIKQWVTFSFAETEVSSFSQRSNFKKRFRPIVPPHWQTQKTNFQCSFHGSYQWRRQDFVTGGKWGMGL